MDMKTNTNVSITATLNAEDLRELFENGELSENGVVIGTTDPELKRFREALDHE